MPTVSVIMNCYNSARYLAEAIDSVVAQTFDDWEIVFWDNQSIDDSPKIARRYEPKLRYFRGEKFLPLGAARNEAIAVCQGEFIAILDCDDLWMPTKLAKQVDLIRSDARIGLVFADCDIVNKDAEVLGSYFDRTPPPVSAALIGLLSNRNFIPCPTVLMRREALQKVGGFDPSLRYSEEYELFLRIAQSYDFAHVNERLAKFRIHGGNLTGLGTRGTTLEALAVIKRVARENLQLSFSQRLAVKKRLMALRCKLLVQTLLSLRQARKS